MRVKLLTGAHRHTDGKRYGAGDELDVSKAVYDAFKFKMTPAPEPAEAEPQPPEAAPEPDAVSDVGPDLDQWHDIDVTAAALELALGASLAPQDVGPGSGVDGRILKSDVEAAVG